MRISSSPTRANSIGRCPCRHRVSVLMLLAILVWAGARGEATAAAHAADGLNLARPEPFPEAFRLGSAAAPFGWSTAIGDLDNDGRPDFAIAERLGRGDEGYAYSIELLVSKVQSQTLTFH